MAGSCGQMEFLEGGVIRGTSVLSSDIVSSRVANSVIDGSQLTNTTSIDDPTARVIADALTQLPPATLARLMEILLDSFSPTAVQEPSNTTSDELPTTVIGNRSMLLGRPAAFISFGNYILPAYQGNPCP